METVLTLEHLGLLLPGDVIHSTSDNDCVVSWIRSFRAKAPLALDLLKLLVLACIRCDVSMTSNHIPSEINHLCDYGTQFEHLQAFHELIGAYNLTSRIGRCRPKSVASGGYFARECGCQSPLSRRPGTIRQILDHKMAALLSQRLHCGLHGTPKHPTTRLSPVPARPC